MGDRRIEFKTDAEHDHVNIFVNNTTIRISFDENKYSHKSIPLADSGSVFEYCIQEKSVGNVERAFKVLDDFIEEKKAKSSTHYDKGFIGGLEGARKLFKVALEDLECDTEHERATNP